jgi:hypothetical protein
VAVERLDVRDAERVLQCSSASCQTPRHMRLAMSKAESRTRHSPLGIRLDELKHAVRLE